MPVTYATAHNGGRSEVNMNYIPNSNEYAWINAFQVTDENWSMVGGGLLPPTQQNSDSYPTDLTGTGGGVSKLINVPSQLEKPGDWILSWTGSGCSLAVTMPGGSVTNFSGNGTTSPWRFTPPADISDYCTIRVTIDNLGSGISNLQLYHADDATDLANGNTFTTYFKNKLREANFGVIRFLNWQCCNTTGETTWSTRKPPTALSFGRRDMRPDYYCGQTTSAGLVYAVGVPAKHSSDGTTWTNGQAPKDKDTIIVRFGSSYTNGTPISITLQVGTGGASSAITADHNSHTPLSTGSWPVAGRYACLVYHAALNIWIKFGGDSDLNSYGIENGVPIEYLLQLCKEVGAHPWFHIPPYALDPVTDWLPEMAAYVAANKPAWMIPRFEVFNEFWHPGTYGRYWGDAMATAAGWTSPSFHQWYGKAVVSAGQVLNTILGVGNYHLNCAVQTGTGNTLGSCQTSDERLSSQSYFSQAAAAQTSLSGTWGTINFSKAHAYNYATHVTCASYFNPITLDPSGGTPPLLTSLAASVGGVRFPILTCSGGTMTVTTSAIETSGGALTSGMTLAGLGIPAGTTVTGVSGTTTKTLTLSQSFTLPAGWHVYAYLTSGASALQDYVDTVSLAVVFNASTSGDVMTVHSTTGGSSGVNSIQIGQVVNWTGGWANSFITGNNSTDVSLTGTGGVGTYRLNAAPGSGAITTTNVTAFWIYSNVYLQIVLANWKQWAQGFATPVNKMNFYEGGYSPDYSNFTSAVTVMSYLGKFVSSTSRRAGGIGGYNTDNYNICTGFSGGGFTSEFPSQYLMTGPYPSIQVWNMLETIYANNTPVFDSIVLYNQVAQYFINLRLRLHA